MFRHSARTLPLKNSAKVGLPGRLKSSVKPRWKADIQIARDELRPIIVPDGLGIAELPEARVFKLLRFKEPRALGRGRAAVCIFRCRVDTLAPEGTVP